MMKKKIGFFVAALFMLFVMLPVAVSAKATDEILDYEITIDVNEDATLNINYHIDWKVLDSDELGPLTWMNVGVPNSHVLSSQALSDTIENIEISGTYAKVYLDKSYYAGDVASVDFKIIQDYMYQVDKLREGETIYSFTPGWFDDISVDRLVIKWKNDKATSFSPECFMEGDYNTWETSLEPGDKFTVTMGYPNDAYGFDLNKSEEAEESSAWDNAVDIIGTILAFLFFIVIFFGIFFGIVVDIYNKGSGFGNTVTKTTRVKVTYYDSCPGCGAPRKEGHKFCEYCGKSLVKSEETITEEQLKKEEKEAAKYTRNGEFQYGSLPNVYIRVNHVRVPNPHPAPKSSRSSSCAHSSCACACACACAGGGRAGCTSKDFYNTGLKFSAIKRTLNGRRI